MSLPSIVILGKDDEGLELFLKKEGLHIVKLNDVEELKKRLIKEEIGVILIGEANKFPLSSLYKLLVDISPDTKVVMFGSGSKKFAPYWIYGYIRWPTDDKFFVLETIKTGILEYSLLKRQRLFIERMLSKDKEISKQKRHKISINSDTLQILRSFNIELSTSRNLKRSVDITKTYTQKLFDISFFCTILKLNAYFQILAFNTKGSKRNLLEKFILIGSHLDFYLDRHHVCP